jgi:hypothetical protein
LSLLKDTTLNVQISTDSKTIDTRQTTTIPKESETKFIPVLETSSLPPNNNSFSEISTSSTLGEAADRNSAREFVQNKKEPTNSKGFTDNDLHIEKNTNPEIDKIEMEILTALKRLGGSEGGSGGGSGDGEGSDSEEDVIYPTAKRSDKGVKGVD